MTTLLTRPDRLWMKLTLSMVVTLPLFAQVPTVFIDTPTSGASISGTVTVSGWAIDNYANTNYASTASAISYVVIQVDGYTVGTATSGLSRPDVCQTLG